MAFTSSWRVVPFSLRVRTSVTSRPDVLAQQLVGLEQVVLVVLLEHAQARRIGQRAEVHGGRVHGRGDVDKLQVGSRRRWMANSRTSRTSARLEL